jgi:hypothetical protein
MCGSILGFENKEELQRHRLSNKQELQRHRLSIKEPCPVWLVLSLLGRQHAYTLLQYYTDRTFWYDEASKRSLPIAAQGPQAVTTDKNKVLIVVGLLFIP